MVIVKHFKKGTSALWEENDLYNEFFLKHVEQTMNEYLKYKSFVTLKDVYDMIGFQTTDISLYYGWTKEQYDHIKMKTIKEENSFKIVFKVEPILPWIPKEEGMRTKA